VLLSHGVFLSSTANNTCCVFWPSPHSTVAHQPPTQTTNRPPASTELRALLQDPFGHAPDADASTSMGAGGSQPLGSISKLSPVRASKKAQGCLGADNGQVLTPVRRSARKPTVRSSQLGRTPAANELAMLEATNFCYEGNPILTPAARNDSKKR